MSDLHEDLRTTVRGLRRHRAFTLGAATVLAIGIAATTSLFALVRGVVLKPLPYPDPEGLVVLVEDGPTPAAVDWPTSVGRLADFSATGVFAGGLAASRGADLVLVGAAGAERLTGARATGNFFAVLGVDAQRGRLLAPGDAVDGAAAVAVVSDGLWRRRFGADPAIVGRPVTLDGVARTVVGVAPAGFAMPRSNVEVWVPFVPTERERDRAWFALRTVGRLAPGLTLELAQARLRDVATRLDAEYPDTDRGNRPRLVPLLDDVLGPSRGALRLLQSAVLLVLVIAVANLANLLVARGAGRETELALRAALGAGRLRVLRLHLAEGTTIGVVAALLGLPLAVAALHAALAAAGDALPRAADVKLDGPVLAAGAATAVAAALLASLVAGATALARSPARGLRGAGKGTALGTRRRVLAAFVVVEVAAATALATGTGLLLRSLAAVTATDVGFDARQVVALEVAQPPGADLPTTAAYYRRLLERLRDVPGIDAVSAVSRLPVVGGTASTGYELEGQPNAPGENPVADLRYVEPGALPLLAVPLLAGRDVAPDDRPDSTRVVLVNETFARRHFQGGEAVGKRLFWGNERGEWRTIVGVVGDVHLAALERPVEPTIWAPVAQASFPGSTRAVAVVARTPLPPPDALRRLRAAIASFDALQAPAKEAALAETLAGALAPRRFQTGLFAAFAIAAALLAAVGVYAVVSYSVAARRDEFGVRLALGSRGASLLRLVLRDALRLALLGAVLGAAVAVAGNRLVAAALVGTRPWDAGVLATALVAAVATGVLAALGPALRAARTPPQRALRAS